MREGKELEKLINEIFVIAPTVEEALHLMHLQGYTVEEALRLMYLQGDRDMVRDYLVEQGGSDGNDIPS